MLQKDVFTPEQIAAVDCSRGDGDWKGVILCAHSTLDFRLRDVTEPSMERDRFPVGEETIKVTTRKTRKDCHRPDSSAVAPNGLKTQTRGIGKAPYCRGLTGKSGGWQKRTVYEIQAHHGKSGDSWNTLLRQADGAGRSQSSLSFPFIAAFL